MVCDTCSGVGQVGTEQFGAESFGTQDARFCSRCGRAYAKSGWTVAGERLVRPREGRMLAGVCAGIAARYGWDPVLVRVLAVIMFFGGFGTLLLVYIAAWIIMPNAPLAYLAPPATANFSGSTPSV